VSRIRIADPALRLGEAERRLRRGEADVRRLQDLHAAGEREAVHGGDDRFPELELPEERGLEDRPVGEQCAIELVLGRPRLAEQRDQAPQVRTGAERVALAGQDRDAERRIVAELLPRLGEADDHLGRDRVLLRGAVERDLEDRAASFDEKVRHS
jgi:hypothetical protein